MRLAMACVSHAALGQQCLQGSEVAVAEFLGSRSTMQWDEVSLRPEKPALALALQGELPRG